MTKQKRKARSRGDLEQELRNQLALLKHACDTFDKGLTQIGKHIALSLRVLLYHHGQSQALLRQLGLLDKRFLNSAEDIDRNNVMTEWNLCTIRLGSDGGYFLAKCLSGDGTNSLRWSRFETWWNNPVIKDEQRRFFNRRELVLNVADTDGGAHVDSELEEAYMALSRENSLAWYFSDGENSTPFIGPELQCMRQIAYEVLETIKKKAPQYCP